MHDGRLRLGFFAGQGIAKKAGFGYFLKSDEFQKLNGIAFESKKNVLR